MPITNESKKALKQEIDRLQGQKNILQKKIDELKDRRDQLVSRLNDINNEINKIKVDHG